MQQRRKSGDVNLREGSELVGINQRLPQRKQFKKLLAAYSSKSCQTAVVAAVETMQAAVAVVVVVVALHLGEETKDLSAMLPPLWQCYRTKLLPQVGHHSAAAAAARRCSHCPGCRRESCQRRCNHPANHCRDNRCPGCNHCPGSCRDRAYTTNAGQVGSVRVVRSVRVAHAVEVSRTMLIPAVDI